jgi:hypothetical protein
MIIEEEISIRAPLSRVWQVFANLAAWGEWNSVCQDCCLVSGEAMAPGTCFTFKLRPYYLPIKIPLQITRCDHGREVVWEGQRFGVRGVHRFAFREEGGEVILTSVEIFSGPLFFLSRLLLVPRRLHQLSKKLLQDVKKAAETCQPGTPTAADLSGRGQLPGCR